MRIRKYVETVDLFGRPDRDRASLDRLSNAVDRMIHTHLYCRRMFFPFVYMNLELIKSSWSDSEPEDKEEVFKPFGEHKTGFFWTDDMIIDNLVTDKKLINDLQTLLDQGAFDREVDETTDYAELSVYIDW